MSATTMLLGLSVVVAFVLALLIVYVAGYLKERYDAARLTRVLSPQEESILQFQQKSSQEQSSRLLQKLSDKLWFAGMEMVGVPLFLTIVTVSGVVGGLLFYIVFENPLALVIGAGVVGMIPFAVRNRLIDMRARNFNEALSEAMSVIVRMMRNGVGFEVALRRAVEISQSRLFQTLFDKYLKEKDLLSEEKAFENMYRHVDSAELRIFGLAITIGKSSGGKFSNTLEKLEHSIKQRVLLQKKVTVATREAKVGSYLIVGLLIFIFFILDSNFDGKIVAHFFHTKEGKFQMLMILVWVGLGLGINEKLTRVQR